MLVGWKVKYTVWPLVIVLAVATALVIIPSGNPVNILFHLLGIAGLILVYLSGPGAMAVSKH